MSERVLFDFKNSADSKGVHCAGQKRMFPKLDAERDGKREPENGKKVVQREQGTSAGERDGREGTQAAETEGATSESRCE